MRAPTVHKVAPNWNRKHFRATQNKIRAETIETKWAQGKQHSNTHELNSKVIENILETLNPKLPSVSKASENKFSKHATPHQTH